MRIQTVSALMVFAAIASFVPTGQAQRSRPDRPRESQPSQFERQRSPAPPPNNLPTSPILPMTNPIAPIVTSPVQPFVRIGPIPEVVFPTREPARPSEPDRRRRGRNAPVVVVGGGYIVTDGFPGYYYPYPQPYMSPAPIPGQLPNTYYPSVESVPAAVMPIPSAAPTLPVYGPQVEYVPEQNMIITPPMPERTVVPPAIGTSKADVLARYGDPWGSVRVQGRETLYFAGGLELVLENDRVTQIR